MKRISIALVLAFAAAPTTGCGGSNPNAIRQPAKQQYTVVPATGAPVAAQPGQAGAADPNDIAKNPFVVWVKKTYPSEASNIITKYLAQDGKVDKDRDTLRKQALDQTATELNKQVSLSLPPGLTAKKVGNNVSVSGATDYQGQKIAVRFEFRVSLLGNGFLKIDGPRTSVWAGSANDSILVEWFGGDVASKAYAEIVKNLDKEGPANQARTPGMTYQKGGVFLINPGVAFVNMPA